MFRLYSKGCEYTIRALMHFVPHVNERKLTAGEICQKAKIPESFTRKIFQSLVQGGLLKAATGPGGGYSLTCHPAKISILSVIQAVDGKETFESCIMGLQKCNRRRVCSLHQSWIRAKRSLLSELKSTTLQDLVA